MFAIFFLLQKSYLIGASFDRGDYLDVFEVPHISVLAFIYWLRNILKGILEC